MRRKECRYDKCIGEQSCSPLHALHAGENGVFLRRFVTELLPVNGRLAHSQNELIPPRGRLGALAVAASLQTPGNPK